MINEEIILPDPNVTCADCAACCCRLDVTLLTETGVPDRFIEVDEFGAQYMVHLQDGWCAALDRGTMKCTIYENRPLVCREFVMGDYECLFERAANAESGEGA